MFEQQSLDALASISKQRNLGEHVHTLEICAYHLLPLQDLEEIEPPYHPYEEIMKKALSGTTDASDEDEASSSSSLYRDRHLRGIDTNTYLRCLEDQERLVRTEYAITSLTQTMTHLTQCKRIVIDDSNHPWGLHQIKRSIGVLPQRSLTFESAKSVDFIRHLIHAVLTAVIASKLQIEELEISLGGLMENANRISPQMLPGPSFVFLARALPITSLRYLHIVLDPCLPESSYGLPWEHGLAEFVSLFPQLSQVLLEFDGRDNLGRFSSVSPLLYFPKLEMLTLSCIDCTSEELVCLLLRHKETLQEIIFDSIDVTDGRGGWLHLIKSIRNSLDNIVYFSMVGSMGGGMDVQSDALEAINTVATIVQKEGVVGA
jgi:hypothetical protein